MAAVNTTCCFGNTTVSKCITGGVLQSVKLTGHVHVMMKSRLAVQDEDDGDGSVKSSMLCFRDMSITARGSVRQLRGHCCLKGAGLGEYPAHPPVELGA